jgi:hypothetical protein
VFVLVDDVGEPVGLLLRMMISTERGRGFIQSKQEVPPTLL